MARARKWRQKYTVTEYQAAALKYLQPPDSLTVSQWAERYRVLDPSVAIPGPWSNKRTPYLVGVMDELLNYETQEIYLCFPTQVGKSESELNMLGYAITQDPGPVMMAYPTDKLAESIGENRLIPMINYCAPLKALYQPLQSQKSELQFEGVTVFLTGSNSAANLSSRSIRYVFVDEADKFPGSSKKEANPISLVKERLATYWDNGGKFVVSSTPTNRTGYIWRALESADVVKHYRVPCPHCGKMIELRFANFVIPERELDAEGAPVLSDVERADLAAYACQECGAMIMDADKPAMLQGGEWFVATERNPVHRRVAFWLNVLYSPIRSFADVAIEYIEAQRDPERMQNFQNSWLAEPYEETQLQTTADMVMERRTELKEFTVPEWAQLVTGGVDVQETSLYYSIRAWGEYSTSQCITYGQVDSWDAIERVMNLTFPREGDGAELPVELCLVDSGYNSDATYEFCALNSAWAMPVKGSSNPNMVNDYKLSKINRDGSACNGMNLALINGGAYKTQIASRMRRQNGRGSWMVHAQTDREYASQVTAEHCIEEQRGGQRVRIWKPKKSHGDNHYLDCEVYAYAAADLCGLRSLYLQRLPERAERPAPEPHRETAHNNVGGNSGWLSGGGARRLGWI